MFNKLTKLFKSTPTRQSSTATAPKVQTLNMSSLHDDTLIHIFSFIDDQSLVSYMRIASNALSENVIHSVIRSNENVIADCMSDFEFICKYFTQDFVKKTKGFEQCYLCVKFLDQLPEGGKFVMSCFGKLELFNISFTREEFSDLLSNSFIRKLNVVDCTLRTETPQDYENHLKRTITLSPYLTSFSTRGEFNIVYYTLLMTNLDLSKRVGKKLDLIYETVLDECEKSLISKLSPCLTGLGLLEKSIIVESFRNYEKILIDNLQQLKPNQTCRKLVVNEFSLLEFGQSINNGIDFPSVKKLVIKNFLHDYSKQEVNISEVLFTIFFNFPNLEYLVLPENMANSQLRCDVFETLNTHSMKMIQIQHSYSGITSKACFLKYILEKSLPHLKISLKREKLIYESSMVHIPTDELSIIVRKIANLERMPEFNSDSSFKDLVNDVKLKFIQAFNSHQNEEINKLMEILNRDFQHFQSTNSPEQQKLQDYRKYIQNYLDLVGEVEVYLEMMQILRQAENAMTRAPRSLVFKMAELETQFRMMVKALESFGFSP